MTETPDPQHPTQPDPQSQGQQPAQQWAGVIPYVEHHEGERRMLTLHLTTGNVMIQSSQQGKLPPIVSIDGRQYIVYWGSMTFEVPADRAVHVSVHVEGDYVTQAASTLLPPGPSLALQYSTNFRSGGGTLAQVG